jgi:hypothetical protein
MATPKRYECEACGARGVKLRCEYQAFLENQRLLCRTCAETDQQPGDGREPTWLKYGGDQIGWLVPAVPTDLPKGRDWKLPRGYTFWGYSSVPQDGCDWWGQLHGIGSRPRP